MRPRMRKQRRDGVAHATRKGLPCWQTGWHTQPEKVCHRMMDGGKMQVRTSAVLAFFGLLLACALSAGPAFALTVAPQDDEAPVDFYAVLHEDGSLVFQIEASSDEDVENIAGSLVGYASASKVPWHAYADRITSVRFDESFASLQPLSTKYWFQGCSHMRMIDLANLDASQSDSMRSMFNGCTELAEVRGIEGLDTSSSTYFGSMFRDCASLTELDVSHFNASHVEVLCFMFNGCSKLKKLTFAGEGWASPNLHLMVHVWEGCSSLQSLDLSGLDTSHVTSMTYDFNGCSSLEYLNLSTVDVSSLGNMAGMFDGCSSLKTVVLGNGFSFCGKGTERKVALPDGNWRSSTDGAVYACDAIPNHVAATYTLTADPVGAPAVVADPTQGTDPDADSRTEPKTDSNINPNTEPKAEPETTPAPTKKAASVKQLVKSKTIKASKLKKAKKAFKVLKPITDGKVTYKVLKNTAKKRLSFKNGKLTVKKGTPRGTYKLKVKVSAKAGKKYKALKAKSFTIVIKVK